MLSISDQSKILSYSEELMDSRACDVLLTTDHGDALSPIFLEQGSHHLLRSG